MDPQHILDIALMVIVPVGGWFFSRLASKTDDLSDRVVRAESRLDSINEATAAINQVREDVSYLKATMEQLMIRIDRK